jgi:hypothetical protein
MEYVSKNRLKKGSDDLFNEYEFKSDTFQIFEESDDTTSQLYIPLRTSSLISDELFNWCRTCF